MKVADLTVDELQALIRKVVRLQSSPSSSEQIPFEEVKTRLNLA